MDALHPAPGNVVAIHVAPTAGAPMRSLERVRAIAGAGLEGDRYALGQGHWTAIARRGESVTLIAAEALRGLEVEHGLAFAPGETRRNLTTRGIALDSLLGRRFRVGGALLEGTRRCEPCTYLEGLLGREVLYPLVHHAGIRAAILEDGEIRVGDPIAAIPGPLGEEKGAP